MKLVFCVVHQRDKNRIAEALVRAGFKSTVIGSTGGFLREGNATFLVGVEEDQLEPLKALIQENCHLRDQVINVGPPEAGLAVGLTQDPITVQVGGAVAFVVNVDEFYRC
ncbi:MAG: cyclic-di-AMP receptor [Armatimonadetes bacterium]|nr:cyclic-di-AMP receptor [Armatimonadota bacterium]